MERYRISITQRRLKKFEQNNKTIALNILFVQHDKKEISHAYISKYNKKRKNQVILLQEVCLHCLEE